MAPAGKGGLGVAVAAIRLIFRGFTTRHELGLGQHRSALDADRVARAFGACCAFAGRFDGSAATAAPAAQAVEAVNVRTDVTAIDLTGVAEFQKTDTDRISVSAAPGADGIVRRIERARARRLDQLGGVRARQFRRRADRPADRRAALPDGRLGPAAGPISGCRASSPSRRAPASGRSGRTAPPPTCSASRSIPARSSPTSPSCAPTACRSSICGSPTPTRTRSTASRSTTASSSASPACWRCS